MTKLAAASGVVVYEDGRKLFICKQPGSWASTFLFVSSLLGLITFINGVIQLFAAAKPDHSSNPGIILVVIGILFIFLSWRVRLYQKKKASVPPDQLPIIAIMDFQSNVLLDREQQLLAPLHKVCLRRKMQWSSSSPELRLEWDRGSLSILKGNPFSGGAGFIEQALLSKGIRKA